MSESRTQVVFGDGNPNASIMFVGEAPGREEDQAGRPFVGRSGRLLDRLLGEAGIAREQTYVANLVGCRPPQNRNPLAEEIAACQHWLRAQLEIVDPEVICSLGNFATKLLRNDSTGITRIHGSAERVNIAGVERTLYPLFHPAAALRSRATLELLAADLLRLPGLLMERGADAGHR